MTTTDRLLACLGVCEASGMFDPDAIAREKQYATALGGWPCMALRECTPSVTVYIRADGVIFSLGGTMPIDGAGVARYAVNLAACASVAAKCDAILRAE